MLVRLIFVFIDLPLQGSVVVEYREFGRTRFKVSRIGMGTYYDKSSVVTSSLFRNQRRTSETMAVLQNGLGLFRRHGVRFEKNPVLRKGLGLLRPQRGRSEKIAALRKGLAFGINLIDTAEVYQTEDIVAEAIAGHRRETLFISTKVSWDHLKYNDVLKAADNSLKRLKCSYIDLYQIHWPNPRVPIKGTMKAMEKLVENGKIRFIGVSNFSIEQMRQAEEALSKSKLVSNEVEYSLMARRAEKNLLPYCERNGIALMCARPIAAGALAKPNKKLEVIMDEISQKYGGKTPVQIALNWLITKSKVTFPIPRASRRERISENVGSVGWSIDVEDIRKLEEAAPRFEPSHGAWLEY
jgi:diketogulonate reductase-like aldo/keto reductase